jgi:predicted Zn-dependent protease
MFLLLISNLFAKEYNKDSFEKFADWNNKKPEQILICDDVKIKTKTVQKSLNFWNQYFNDYKSVDIKNIKCDDNIEFIENSIIITSKRILDSEEFFHGMTYFEYAGHSLISAIRIEINLDYENSSNLFTHELGHAIGIDHEAHDQVHIMHAKCDLY